MGNERTYYEAFRRGPRQLTRSKGIELGSRVQSRGQRISRRRCVDVGVSWDVVLIEKKSGEPDARKCIPMLHKHVVQNKTEILFLLYG